MPLEFTDLGMDDEARADGEPRFRPRFGFDEPRKPWWRPASRAGRILLGTCTLVVLGGLTTAGLTLKTYLQRDSRFRIAGTEDIQTAGLTEVSRAQMLPVFGEDIGRNIFFVPLSQRRQQLEQFPWIQRATVMRLLPDQIRVVVVERQPVAFTRQGNQIGLVDANGVLLSMPAVSMARHHYSFPVLTGIDPGDPLAARTTRMAVYLRLMAQLDSTGQHYSQQISEIDLTDPEDARVILPEQGADILAHFGEDHFLDRYLRLKAHIAEWRQQYPHLSAVDLRYDQQVVLEMASGSETATDAKPLAGQPAGVPDAVKSPAARSADANARGPAGGAAQARKAAADKKRAEERRAAILAARRKAAARLVLRWNQEHGNDVPSGSGTRPRPGAAQGG